MHIEFLVEDQSGEKFLKIIVPKIIDMAKITCQYRHYYGVGRIPKNMRSRDEIKHRQLLNDLPKMLKAYGKCFQNYDSAVIVVCDLDHKCQKQFRVELNSLLDACHPKPNAFFCIAIEEMEAWLLGDQQAILKAYPRAKLKLLKNYRQDSICGTWEMLADIIYSGGSKKLMKEGFQKIGEQKSIWAECISKRINDPGANSSPSFQYFYKKIKYIVENVTRESN